MRRVLGPALLLLSVIVTVQGWRTAQPSPAVQTLAREVLCAKGKQCPEVGDSPRESQASSFGHRYRFTVAGGEQWIACKRQWLIAGGWSCTVG